MNSQKSAFVPSLLALALYAAMASTSAQTAPTPTGTEPESADREGSRSADNVTEIEHVQVTGSRLDNGNPTASVTVITAEEIKARGVTNVEDLIRTLAQNVATIGAITNERKKGPLAERKAPVSAIGTLGVSAANLGGMGAGNTLVLVNGRRIAGAAGIEDGFVNLNGIPLSAVDRVEITMSGASAVYGADATAGVINFILKNDYTKTTATAQQEYSSNNADTDRISLFSGTAWGSGSISGTLDYNHRRPINNHKSGYVTENYSSYYDGDTTFDTRTFGRGLQPGVVDTSYWLYDKNFNTTKVTRGMTVPAGFVGVPTLDDMITVGAEALPDYVPELAGPDTESYSATLNFQQDLTDRLSVSIDGLYNRSTNSQELLYDSGLSLQLAPGQAYNPFPAYYSSPYTPGMTVYYSPAAEIAAGELPVGRVSNTASNWNINAGLTYRFNPETKVELTYTTSRSDTGGQLPNLASVVSLVTDATSPNGVSCYNYQLAQNHLSARDRQYLQSVFDRQCLALTSTDPALAFDPWKSSAGGPGASVGDFFYTPVHEQRQSRISNWQANLNGMFLTLPAGRIHYSVGGEIYDDGVDSSEISNITKSSGSRDRYAYFGEMNIPVFGGEFSFPGMRSLILSLAARHDSYTTDGPVGTVDGIPIDQGGEPIIKKNTFARTTPAYGIRWEPFASLALRARWTEGFQAPPLTQLFTAVGVSTYLTTIYNDPLYQCTSDCTDNSSPNAYAVVQRTTSNPDLKPQTSTQSSYGLTWQPSGWLEGLTLDVNYNRTRIENEFATPTDLQELMTQDQILRLQKFYPRDPVTNKILESRYMTFNILGSEYESIIYELGYLWMTEWGMFEPKISYLDNLKSERRAFADVPASSNLGYLQGPDDYKITGSLNWSYHDVSSSLWLYYTPGYINDYEVDQYAGEILDRRRYKQVAAYLTVDLTTSWRINDCITLNFAGRNIFDREPPFVVVGGRPYDTSRYNAAGRTLSLEIAYSY